MFWVDQTCKAAVNLTLKLVFDLTHSTSIICVILKGVIDFVLLYKNTGSVVYCLFVFHLIAACSVAPLSFAVSFIFLFIYLFKGERSSHLHRPCLSISRTASYHE